VDPDDRTPPLTPHPRVLPRSHQKRRWTAATNTDSLAAMPDKTKSRLPAIEPRIIRMRGVAVLLDSHLAGLYGVTTGALLQAVRRNADRFPADFAFQLTDHEVRSLRSQFVISNTGAQRGGRRYRPYAFTEEGVAMLSSVLRSPTAVRANIEIMRAFVRLRRAALVSQQLLRLVEDLSRRVDSHDQAIAALVEAIKDLVSSPRSAKTRSIGFTADLGGAEP